MTPPPKVKPMPTSVKVGPLVYEIASDSMSHLVAEHSQRQGLYGQCDHKTLTIMVAPELAPMQTRATLTHELLHAVISVSGVEIDSADEERFVAVLEMPLLALVRDNPDLLAYLTGA